MTVALTKKQRATAAGLELIALCQTVTEDGSINEDEVRALMRWLADNEDCGLPAHALLCQTVQQIIADGKITTDERRLLFKAIEVVLPVDLRGLVKARRVAVELAEQERNSPIAGVDFFVAGVRYEGRAALVARHARGGDPVRLVRDPENRYSRNATQVRLENDLQIGFVPEEDALEVAPLLDAGHPYRGVIKTLYPSNDGTLIPIIVAEFFRHDWEGSSTA